MNPVHPPHRTPTRRRFDGTSRSEPVLVLLGWLSVMLVIGGFNVFISVLLMTAGGPAGETEMPLTYLYKQAFNFLEFGYGSAIAVIMTVLILILSIGQTLIANRAERGE